MQSPYTVHTAELFAQSQHASSPVEDIVQAMRRFERWDAMTGDSALVWIEDVTGSVVVVNTVYAVTRLGRVGDWPPLRRAAVLY